MSHLIRCNICNTEVPWNSGVNYKKTYHEILVDRGDYQFDICDTCLKRILKELFHMHEKDDKSFWEGDYEK